jgi:hypothetical protein
VGPAGIQYLARGLHARGVRTQNDDAIALGDEGLSLEPLKVVTRLWPSRRSRGTSLRC